MKAFLLHHFPRQPPTPSNANATELNRFALQFEIPHDDSPVGSASKARVTAALAGKSRDDVSQVVMLVEARSKQIAVYARHKDGIYERDSVRLGRNQALIALLSDSPRQRTQAARVALDSYMRAARWAALGEDADDRQDLISTVSHLVAAQDLASEFDLPFNAKVARDLIWQTQTHIASLDRQGGVIRPDPHPTSQEVSAILESDRIAVERFGIPSILKRDGVRAIFDDPWD